jgi:5,10-methenyltetrahydrofolate synthetase
MANGVRPTIFYFNPNIWPREEYEIRKNESKRHAERLGLEWIDGDYDHEAWRTNICGLENQPERGLRCEQCFMLRLTETARKAQELGFPYFATTLASSRWKSLEQIERAGLAAEQAVSLHSHFWAQNWRKGGLQERRNQLLKENQFYNQQYCGCEFSARNGANTKPLLRAQMREAKKQHQAQLARMSEDIVRKLQGMTESRNVRTVMAYWPLPDEVDIRPLVDQLAAQGVSVVLPKVTGDETMELRHYASREDLEEGAFHIMEPVGDAFEAYDQIGLALVPGMAFDAACHRLGRGKGYYDRFLSAHPDIYKIGVCFPFQRVAEVPSEAHDVIMDEVI